MRLPKKITPCPLVESIFELRFESQIPADAIFGIVYSQFKEDYPKVEPLPIQQLPEQIRTNDPNLMFSPHYKLLGENFLIQVGPKVFSVVHAQEYKGWDFFFAEIKRSVEKFQKTEIASEITRAGLRYINVFKDMDVFSRSTINLSIGERNLESCSKSITADISSGSFTNTLRMANNAEINIQGDVFNGSVIDIDTYIVNPQEIINEAEKAHIEEKNIFFSLLKDDFISDLNPDYE